jgi:hypothetical protein
VCVCVWGGGQKREPSGFGIKINEYGVSVDENDHIYPCQKRNLKPRIESSKQKPLLCFCGHIIHYRLVEN